ncbi:DUF6285 domain-containing protein [Tsuneonella amylolytica]|uniref:DUF6285 domain-containing protein n=1 Tax=Tsuneonella amylolytica TaxID=2338327 RepID=UPI000EA964D2|nr:DUF6285 domain-containing protein [Tsuneonella amylolytica]
MADSPPPAMLIAEVRRALDEGLAPGFPQKVAANALGIAQRELENGPPVSAEEAARMCAAIRAGEDGADLVGELIALTIAKLEIDQPAYPSFRAWKDGG